MLLRAFTAALCCANRLRGSYTLIAHFIPACRLIFSKGRNGRKRVPQHSERFSAALSRCVFGVVVLPYPAWIVRGCFPVRTAALCLCRCVPFSYSKTVRRLFCRVTACLSVAFSRPHGGFYQYRMLVRGWSPSARRLLPVPHGLSVTVSLFLISRPRVGFSAV